MNPPKLTKDGENKDNLFDLLIEINLFLEQMPFARLQKEIGRSKILSPQEEKKLFQQYKTTKGLTSKRKVRDQIIQSNLKLVSGIAEKLKRKSGENISDLFQQGLLGLVNAIEKFDVNRGFKFSTFAYPQISGSIRDYISKRKSLKKREPLEGKESIIDKIDKFILTHKAEEPEEKILNRLEAQRLLKKLNPTEQKVAELRFMGGETLGEISSKLNVSGETVRKMLLNIRKKLLKYR